MRREPKPRLYTEREAEIIGRRSVCYTEGHDLVLSSMSGGVQGITEAEARALGVMVAACDKIKCRRCDVAFTATYPEIGQEQ
jgi:hypothetical protein